MRLEGIVDKAVVLIDEGWPWLSIRPSYGDLAPEGMNKFGPGLGNAPGWLSTRPEYEVIGLLLTPKQRMYEGMPSLFESTGIDLASINVSTK